MHHRRALVHRQELAGPDVELRGAHRHQRRPPAGDPEFIPVVVQTADGLLGEPVAQHRAREVGIECLEVEGGEHRLRGTAEVDSGLIRHLYDNRRRGDPPGIADSPTPATPAQKGTQ
jgi:hypothetical protein